MKGHRERLAVRSCIKNQLTCKVESLIFDIDFGMNMILDTHGHENGRVTHLVLLSFETTFQVLLPPTFRRFPHRSNALNISVEVQVSILSMKNTVLAHVSIEFWTS